MTFMLLTISYSMTSLIDSNLTLAWPTSFSRLSRLCRHCAHDMNNFPSGQFSNLHKETKKLSAKEDIGRVRLEQLPTEVSEATVWFSYVLQLLWSSITGAYLASCSVK